MSSEVDICNLAMSHIGQDGDITAIDPPDGSAAADHCARFYPIARDAMLEAHSWRFNTRRAELTQLDDNEQESLWAYAYQLPNQALLPLRVITAESTDDTESAPFAVETLEGGSQVLYTTIDDAWLVYRWRQEDTAKFSPTFVICLSLLLGSFLAGVIPKDLKMKAGLYRDYLAAGGPPIQASALDANGQRAHPLQRDWRPGHLRARE